MNESTYYFKLVEMPGFEPGASYMRSKRSTAELHPQWWIQIVKSYNDFPLNYLNVKQPTLKHFQLTVYIQLTMGKPELESLWICSGKEKNLWARPGFEPGTSRTRSANHTPRPTSRC